MHYDLGGYNRRYNVGVCIMKPLICTNETYWYPWPCTIASLFDIRNIGMLIWSWITLLYLECQDKRFAGLIILAGNHLCINSVSTKREQNLTKSDGEKLSKVVDALTVCMDESASLLKWTVIPLLCFASVQSSSEWSSCSRDSTWSACSITSSIICWIGLSVSVSSILDSSCTADLASKIRPCSTYWYR